MYYSYVVSKRLVGRAYRVKCMGRAIAHRLPSQQLKEATVRASGLELTKWLTFVHSDDRIVVLNTKEVAGVGRR